MINLLNFILRNRFLVMVVGALVVAAGIWSYQQLPVNAFPDVSPSLVQVFTETEGLAPEEIEKYVTYPVETAMNGLPGVRNIRSVSNFGLSVVNIYFDEGTDIYFARHLVGERLQEARERIPEGFGEPAMGPISTGMGLVLFYYLDDESGKYSLEELRSIQDWIVKFQLQTVPGVTEVLGIGGYEKQYHVVVDPFALQRYDVTISEVIDIIRKNNLNVGAQFIERNAEELVVRSVGLASGIEDLENIVVKNSDGTPVFLRQLAAIEIGGAVRRGIQTRDGVTEVVAGQVVKLFGSNSSTVIQLVEEKMKEINEILPEGVRIVPYYEQKSLVEASVKTVSNALIQGMILVALVLVLFMGSLRPSIVVISAIPFSVLFAMIGMYLFDISINLMSFGGLAIAIGMMVDATVVLAERVDVMLRVDGHRHSMFEIIGRTFKDVARPVIFAVSIIIVVFLPLFTLEGVEGKTFHPLAYTVALAMLGSLIFAVFFSPALSSLVMKSPRQREDGEKPSFASRLLGAVERQYEKLLRVMVGHRWLAFALLALMLIVGAAIFPRLGSEFTPTLREGTIVLRLTMAPSISLKESKRVAMTVERRLMKVHEVNSVVTRIGRGEVGAHTDPINSAEMYIMLAPKDEWRTADSQEEVQQVIRDEIGTIPGVLANFTQPIQMTVDELLEGVHAELAIKLFGEDLDVLKDKAAEIAQVVGSIEGARDVQPDQISGMPQLLIRVDRESIARYGINVSDVQSVVHAAVGGEMAGEIFDGIRRSNILVRFEEHARHTPAAISNLVIKAPDGADVPLSQLTSIEQLVGPRQIKREQSQRFITVQCNVDGRDIGSFVRESQEAIDRQVTLPPGYLLTWGGQWRLQQEANNRFLVVVPITLLAIFILLYMSFRSIKSTVLIFSNIPLALTGGIVSLYLTGQNLSVPSSVGFIALFGIALENGMVLVSYFNKLVREGMAVDEAAVIGARSRLRPVLMTALTTALGLIPLLIATGTGSEVQRPLATVVVGGLVTSTVLTLLIIPAVYKWFFTLKAVKGKR